MATAHNRRVAPYAMAAQRNTHGLDESLREGATNLLSVERPCSFTFGQVRGDAGDVPCPPALLLCLLRSHG
jgi:hypothetical protein